MSSQIDVESIQDFETLVDLVRHDANLVDKLTPEQITAIRKTVKLYGSTIQGSDKLTCLSITNLAEEYMKKFLMTSLVGFLYRRCDEYKLDDGEPPIHMDEFERFMGEYVKAKEAAEVSNTWLVKFSEEHKDVKDEDISNEDKAKRLDHRRVMERYNGFRDRLIVRQFIDSIFEFNPDVHVRSAYSSNPLDPERVVPAQITKKSDAGKNKKPKKKTKVIKGKDGKTLKIDKSDDKEAEEAEGGDEGTEEVEGSKEAKEVTEADEEATTPDAPTDTTETTNTDPRANSEFVQHIPPADTFHRWSYYTDSNYEEIRCAVNDLYSDKPDLEFAVNPYDQFEDKEAADRFIDKHKDEVITDILMLTNGKWNLCGSFKKNRERIDFYNGNTSIIQQIFKQMEQDKKLGADLMRKRVKRKKQKNVEETGNESKEFQQYKKDNPSGFEAMGAENVLRDEEDGKNKDNKEENTFKVHDDCPYDAVQVDVFDFRKGGATVDKSEFFTEADKTSDVRSRTKAIEKSRMFKEEKKQSE